MDQMLATLAHAMSVRPYFDHEDSDDWLVAIRELLATARSAGYVLVPIAPTRAMIVAGEAGAADGIDETQDSYERYHIIDEARIAFGVWREMVAASSPETNASPADAARSDPK